MIPAVYDPVRNDLGSRLMLLPIPAHGLLQLTDTAHGYRLTASSYWSRLTAPRLMIPVLLPLPI